MTYPQFLNFGYIFGSPAYHNVHFYSQIVIIQFDGVLFYFQNIVVQKMEGNGKVKSYQCRLNDNSGEDEDAVVPNLEISISSSEASQNELAVWPVKKRRKRYLV